MFIDKDPTNSFFAKFWEAVVQRHFKKCLLLKYHQNSWEDILFSKVSDISVILQNYESR